jgi:hypothetical protein
MKKKVWSSKKSLKDQIKKLNENEKKKKKKKLEVVHCVHAPGYLK